MNLEQIAELSGVSRSTVSRVINQDPNVSATTREKVMEVVKRLNFQPHAAAQSLAAGRTRILGLVIPMGVAALFSDPYFPLSCSERLVSLQRPRLFSHAVAGRAGI